MAIRNFDNLARGALVVAHPSHELRVHGWLQMARPCVFILTDGSGRDGRPRLSSSTKVLDDVGAKRGSIYGRFTDREVYAALLKRDFDTFIKLAEELADELDRGDIEYVVADSAEGYSSVHDLCRLVTDAAVEISSRRRSRKISNYEFRVIGPPDESSEICDEAIWVNLDDEAFQRKVAAARGYDSRLAVDIESALGGQSFKGIRRFSDPQLAGDVDKSVSAEIEVDLRSNPEMLLNATDLLEGVELHRFRVECLRPVRNLNENKPSRIPFYELYGEKMVRAGYYETAIRQADHLQPMAEALRQHVDECGRGL